MTLSGIDVSLLKGRSTRLHLLLNQSYPGQVFWKFLKRADGQVNSFGKNSIENL